MSRRSSHGRREPLKVERIMASASITQDSYHARSKIDTEKDDEIDVEIYPDADKKNIARINGNYQSFQCMLDEGELERLPFKLQGTGGSLSDRMKFHLKGEVDRNGQFNLFVVGLATTMVQFKLWGKVFPGVKCPAKEITPDVFREEIFRKLGRLKNSSTPGLQEWVTGMTNFWDKWSGIFQMDLQKDLIRKMEEIRDMMNQRMDTIQERLDRHEHRIALMEAWMQNLNKTLLLSSNGTPMRR